MFWAFKLVWWHCPRLSNYINYISNNTVENKKEIIINELIPALSPAEFVDTVKCLPLQLKRERDYKAAAAVAISLPASDSRSLLHTCTLSCRPVLSLFNLELDEEEDQVFRWKCVKWLIFWRIPISGQRLFECEKPRAYNWRKSVWHFPLNIFIGME